MVKLNFRIVFWTAVTVIVGAALVFAFRPTPLLVDVAEVARGGMTVSVRDEVRARVRDVFVVSAPIGGQLLRVEKEPGDPAHAGETVARLLPPTSGFLDARSRDEANAAAAAAEAALAAARAAGATEAHVHLLACGAVERAAVLRDLRAGALKTVPARPSPVAA